MTDQTCEILEDAIERYKQDLKSHEKIRRMAKVFYRKETRRQTLMQDKNFNGNLVELLVTLSKECEDKPHLNMDEQCKTKFLIFIPIFILSNRMFLFFFKKKKYILISDELIVNDGKAVLSSSSVWGILRGLETWSQLIYISSDLGAVTYRLNCKEPKQKI